MSDAHNDQEQPFISHLLELRSRILRALGGVLAVFLVMLPFANDLFEGVARPALDNFSLISIGSISAFLTPLKFTLVLALFIAIPWVLYQFWAFVAPGLYQSEQRLVLPLLVSSTLLFYIGMAFARYVVLPAFFLFIKHTAPESITVTPDIDLYLSFVLTIFFAFGLSFEVPVAVVLLVVLGVTTPEKLREKRPYVIVGVFFIAAIITPPDVISQTLLAVPMWLLFELGVVCSKVMLKRRDHLFTDMDDEQHNVATTHHDSQEPVQRD